MSALLAADSASVAELVAAELAGAAPSGKAARPQLLAAAVAHSVNHGKLEPEVLQDILQQFPEHPFIWRRVQDEAAEYKPKNGAPSAYETLGGLCVHALLEQRRGGAEGTEHEPLSPHWTPHAEGWRWQLRSPEEFFADLKYEVEHKGLRGNYTKDKYEDQCLTNTPES